MVLPRRMVAKRIYAGPVTIYDAQGKVVEVRPAEAKEWAREPSVRRQMAGWKEGWKGRRKELGRA